VLKLFSKFLGVLIFFVTVIGFSDYKVFAAEYTDTENIQSSWMQVFGASGDQDSVKNVDGFDYTSIGVVIGYDRPINSLFVVGSSLGYISTDVNSDYVDSGSDISTITLGGYGSYNKNNIYLDSTIMYAYSDISNSKSDGLKGDTSSNAFSLTGEAGYNFLYLKKFLIAPFAGFQTSLASMSSYEEKASDGTAISEVDSVNDFFFSTIFGVRANYAIKKNIDLKCRGMWSHEFSDDLQSKYKISNIGTTDYIEANGLVMNIK
jgi:outer membrane autotransporter protein